MKFLRILFLSIAIGGGCDTVFFGGEFEPSAYVYVPLGGSFPLGSASGEILLSTGSDKVNAVGVSPSGRALFVGGYDGNNLPFIYSLSEGSSQLVSVSVPTSSNGELSCLSIGNDGTAFMGGFLHNGSGDGFTPIVYRLEAGSNTATAVTLPDISAGIIYCVAVGPNGVAVVGGINDSNEPCIFTIEPGASSATSITIPSAPFGILFGAAIDSNNTAVLVGGNLSTNIPLIYRLESGASSATAITLPNENEGTASCVAMTPDNVAIIGGSEDAGPLIIWTLASEASAATAISSAINGSINTISIAPSGTAILGGANSSDNTPLAFWLPYQTNELTQISVSENTGEIYGTAVASDGTAILGGTDNTLNLPTLYQLSPLGTIASSISLDTSNDGAVRSVAIYHPSPATSTSTTLYDIDRLRTIYEEELEESKALLQQAGL